MMSRKDKPIERVDSWRLEVGTGVNRPWHEASYRGDEVLKLTHADGCTTQWLLEVTVYWKWVDFMKREVSLVIFEVSGATASLR